MAGSLPPHGGSGLKFSVLDGNWAHQSSPSTRREWIEIPLEQEMQTQKLSPSTRREWIEIVRIVQKQGAELSPSTRREWIEILKFTCKTI